MSLVTEYPGIPEARHIQFYREDIQFVHGKWITRSYEPPFTIPSTSGIHALFMIDGNLRIIRDTSAWLEISTGQQNILLTRDEPVQLQWTPENQVEIVEIRITPGFFESTLSHQPSVESQPILPGDLNTPSFLFPAHLQLTPHIRHLLHEIIHCPLTGYYKELFLKAKVTEILAFQFHRYHQEMTNTPEIPSPVLTIEIRDRMQMVKNIITSRLDDPLSLHDLAQQAGTNESYLKTHFKLMFGTTVFGYIHELRMERAKGLLQNENKPVAEVARILGYKHASHFTTVFKKYFGMTPRAWRG